MFKPTLPLAVKNIASQSRRTYLSMDPTQEGETVKEKREEKGEESEGRKTRQPPPPQKGVRGFLDRQATLVMKCLGVI